MIFNLLGYIDPSITSMLWQIVLAIIAAAAFVYKFFKHKILALFGIKSKDRKSSDPKTETD